MARSMYEETTFGNSVNSSHRKNTSVKVSKDQKI